MTEKPAIGLDELDKRLAGVAQSVAANALKLPPLLGTTPLSQSIAPLKAVSSFIPTDRRSASEVVRALQQWIKDFESQLSASRQIAVQLVNAPGQSLLVLDDVTFVDPVLVRFSGRTGDGIPAQLIQHVHQLSVFLTTVPAEEDPPKAIGFTFLREEELDHAPDVPCGAAED